MPIYYGRVWWRHRYNWCSYCLGLVGTGVLGLREGRFRMAWPQDPVAAYPKECTFLTFTGPIRGHCDQIRGGIKLCGYSNSFNSATPQFSAVFAQFAPHTNDAPKIWVFQNSGVDRFAGWTSYGVYGFDRDTRLFERRYSITPKIRNFCGGSRSANTEGTRSGHAVRGLVRVRVPAAFLVAVVVGIASSSEVSSLQFCSCAPEEY